MGPIIVTKHVAGYRMMGREKMFSIESVAAGEQRLDVILKHLVEIELIGE